MKITITVDGNALSDIFDACQEIADSAFDNIPPEKITFEKWIGKKPKLEVEYDPEEEEDEDDYDYAAQVRADFISGITGRE